MLSITHERFENLDNEITYPKILKCNEFILLLAGFVQTGVLFVFPYFKFSPLRPLSIKYTDYTHGNAICDSSKLYTNITFTFDMTLSLVFFRRPKEVLVK